jgi:hypothetical protein
MQAYWPLFSLVRTVAIAKQLNIPLWTLDKLQGNAAMKSGVSLWEK